MKRSRLVRALGVATLVVMSGVGAGVSGASPAAPDSPVQWPTTTHDDGHGHDHPTTTTTRPDGTTTTRPGGTTTTTRPATTTTQAPAPGTQRKVVNYGPYSIPGAPTNPDGTHGHAHTGNMFQLFAEKPCTNCYITGMRASLKYADGRTAGWSTDAQLHHMVLFNSSWGRQDATCGGQFLGFLGERFFASGDERTVIPTMGQYGYYVGAWDNWTMIYELANHNSTPQNTIVEMTYDWVPASTPGMKPLDPVWLDIVQCGLSEYAVPVGPNTRTYDWVVNRPGRLMGLGGHLHDGGVNLTVQNATTGRMLCDSRARYGESPLYIGHHGDAHISSMSVCTGPNGVDTLVNGQRIRMTANYNSTAAANDAMGIAIMYVART